MIDIQELTKRYRSAVAVDGLTFAVKPGLVTGFLGPNGAGKSTTMRMTLGLARPDRGRALINGRAYHELSDPMRHVGAILEATGPHRGRSAYHHLLWMAQSNRIGKRRVHEVLDMVGLSSVTGQRAGEFSLGMGQRLGLAAALLGDPPVLLLDEPVNGLDPEGIRWLRDLLRGLAAEGRTVFVSSHLMAEMALTADHVIVIAGGRLLADTNMADFVERHARTFVRVRGREPERLHQVLSAAGLTVTPVAGGGFDVSGATAAEINRVAAVNGLTLDELSTRSASLEEAFIELTAGGVDKR